MKLVNPVKESQSRVVKVARNLHRPLQSENTNTSNRLMKIQILLQILQIALSIRCYPHLRVSCLAYCVVLPYYCWKTYAVAYSTPYCSMVDRLSCGA